MVTVWIASVLHRIKGRHLYTVFQTHNTDLILAVTAVSQKVLYTDHSPIHPPLYCLFSQSGPPFVGESDEHRDHFAWHGGRDHLHLLRH